MLARLVALVKRAWGLRVEAVRTPLWVRGAVGDVARRRPAADLPAARAPRAEAGAREAARFLERRTGLTERLPRLEGVTCLCFRAAGEREVAGVRADLAGERLREAAGERVAFARERPRGVEGVAGERARGVVGVRATVRFIGCTYIRRALRRENDRWTNLIASSSSWRFAGGQVQRRRALSLLWFPPFKIDAVVLDRYRRSSYRRHDRRDEDRVESLSKRPAHVV